MRTTVESLTAFLLLAGPATASGFLVCTISPHGMAGFVYSSVVLGIVGGIAFPALWNLMGLDLEVRSSIYIGGGVGFVFGALSFPISTVIAERALHFPRDSFQLALLAYLCALGASLGCLAMVVKRRMKRLNRTEAVTKTPEPPPPSSPHTTTPASPPDHPCA